VFVRSGTTWTQQAYLKASNSGASDQFGIAVAVSGYTVVVGANLEDSNTTGINSTPDELAGASGAAYVFVRSGTTWTQQAYLKASNSGADDRFGIAVEVSGDTVVVGAYLEDSSTTGINSTPNDADSSSGAAYLFTGLGTMGMWAQTYFGNATVNVGNAEDFDSDGVINLLEFAFGTAPDNNASGSASLQYTGTFAGAGTLTSNGQPGTGFEPLDMGIDFRALFVRRNDYAAAGLTYTPQFSANLSTWQDSAAVPTVLVDDGTYQIVSVPYPPYIAGKKARFFRINVTKAQ
jgi:choline dehydrogenase-like flavoprotein